MHVVGKSSIPTARSVELHPLLAGRCTTGKLFQPLADKLSYSRSLGAELSATVFLLGRGFSADIDFFRYAGDGKFLLEVAVIVGGEFKAKISSSNTTAPGYLRFC